jgi:superfamily II DNA or RNA helicase
MDPKILDNSSETFQIGAFLSKELASGKYREFCVATGYWDLPGFTELLEAMKTFFEHEPDGKVKLLIGEEPKVRKADLDDAFPEGYITLDLRDLAYSDRYSEAAGFLVKQMDRGNIQIKLYKCGFLHAKCYILGAVDQKAVGIIGSSNFTRSGLLGNTELNDVEDDHRVVNYIPATDDQDPSHRSWFEKLWNNDCAIDWNREFAHEVIGLSQFGDQTYSPYETYMRTLYEIYGDDIEIEGKQKLETEREDSRVDLVSFQKESALKVRARLSDPRIGMCLLGDSVGLGKSFVAKDVIEEFGYYRRQNVIVICPASLRDDWKKHLRDITVSAPVYSITEFGTESRYEEIKRELMEMRRKSQRDNAIELLVIDESHNLKTQGSRSFQNLLEVINPLNGFCKALPKVLMLSATPVNNGIKDLANQILLARGSNDSFFSFFGIPSITDLFTKTQREFKRLGTEEVFGDLYPILNKIMVKRTRHQVKKDFPNALMNGEPIIFPDEQLVNLLYKMDNKQIRKFIGEILHRLEVGNPALFDHFTRDLTPNEEEDADKLGILEFFQIVGQKSGARAHTYEYESLFHFVDRAIKGLKLVPYSYLSEKISKSPTEQMEANSRKNLTGVMKISLFKSFDSSIHTFNKRIGKYEKNLIEFERQFFEEGRVLKPEILTKSLQVMEDPESAEKLLEDIIEEEIKHFVERQAARAKRGHKAELPFKEVDVTHYNDRRLREFIAQDKAIIALIRELMGEVKTDEKLKQLQEELLRLKGQKVLIFTYFATTADYIYENLKPELLEKLGLEPSNVAVLKSKNGKFKQEYVHRFSPIAQGQTVVNGLVDGKKPELQILVTTDVLSEGQNLQDCGVIINYDLHWNPVKMIQRNGRINRLGSRFKEVTIYNFRPEDELEKFLLLMKRLQEKITIIGASVGIDSSVLGEQITPRQFGLMEKIYGDNTTDHVEALEELERENDLAFDESFENDLRTFLRTASDEEKARLLKMNFNKWCSVPTMGAEERLMSFKVGKGEFEFIVAQNGKVREEENALIALKKIRSFDKERQKERLTQKEKTEWMELASLVFDSKASQKEFFGQEGGLDEFVGVKKSGAGARLAEFKVQLLALLNDNLDRYSEDNINRIRKLLTSNSISLDNKLRNYLKASDYQIGIDFLDNLAILSINMVQNLVEETPPNPELWFGYYPA